MNNLMHGLYTNQSSAKKATPKPSNEPIDISSGDENDDDASRSPTNGGTGNALSEENVPKTLKRPLDSSIAIAVVPPKKGKIYTILDNKVTIPFIDSQTK